LLTGKPGFTPRKFTTLLIGYAHDILAFKNTFRRHYSYRKQALFTQQGIFCSVIYNNFTFRLKESKTTTIIIDEKKRMITINAVQPQAVLVQLKQGLLLIDNNQLLHLDRTARQDNWEIYQYGPCLFIKAPSIVFKVQATDNAGNSSSQELNFR